MNIIKSPDVAPQKTNPFIIVWTHHLKYLLFFLKKLSGWVAGIANPQCFGIQNHCLLIVLVWTSFPHISHPLAFYILFSFSVFCFLSFKLFSSHFQKSILIFYLSFNINPQIFVLQFYSLFRFFEKTFRSHFKDLTFIVHFCRTFV